MRHFAQGSDALFHIYCGFGDACGGFRASFFASFSQTATLTTARKMIDQGSFKDSVCPYECGRRVIRHQVVPTNENNLFGGIGLDGERWGPRSNLAPLASFFAHACSFW